MLIFGTLFTGALATVVLWHSERAASLLSWLGVLYVWTLVRYLLNRLYLRTQSEPSTDPQQAARWGWLGSLVSWLFAVIWGGAVLLERLEQPAPCLLLTGDTAPERLREAGASGFPLLHKPVTPAVLRQALLAILEQRQGAKPPFTQALTQENG